MQNSASGREMARVPRLLSFDAPDQVGPEFLRRSPLGERAKTRETMPSSMTLCEALSSIPLERYN